MSADWWLEHVRWMISLCRNIGNFWRECGKARWWCKVGNCRGKSVQRCKWASSDKGNFLKGAQKSWGNRDTFLLVLSDCKTREGFGKLLKKWVEKRKFSKIIIFSKIFKYLQDDHVAMRLDTLRMTLKGGPGTDGGCYKEKYYCEHEGKVSNSESCSNLQWFYLRNELTLTTGGVPIQA